MPNPFLYKKHFYFKQFTLALVHSLIVKNIFNSIFIYQFSQTVLIQTIQFNINILLFKLSWMSKQFYFKQFSLRSLNVRTVLFQAIQFSLNT